MRDVKPEDLTVEITDADLYFDAVCEDTRFMPPSIATEVNAHCDAMLALLDRMEDENHAWFREDLS